MPLTCICITFLNGYDMDLMALRIGVAWKIQFMSMVLVVIQLYGTKTAYSSSPPTSTPTKAGSASEQAGPDDHTNQRHVRIRPTFLYLTLLFDP